MSGCFSPGRVRGTKHLAHIALADSLDRVVMEPLLSGLGSRTLTAFTLTKHARRTRMRLTRPQRDAPLSVVGLLP
jgi:hypothetical protein